MAQQTINAGNPAETGTTSADKINENFTELYGAAGARLNNYTVYLDSDGITYKALNGSTGVVDHEGTVFHLVINAAMNEDSGRTEPMTVAVTNACQSTGEVLIPDHTYVNISGSVTLTQDIQSMFKNADHAGGNVNIRLMGTGLLDGGAATSGDTNPRSCGVFKNVPDLVVSGLTMQNTSGHNLSVADCPNARIFSNTLLNSGDDNISVLGASGAVILGNICDGTRSDYSAARSSNIEVEVEGGDSAEDIVIANNVCKGSGNAGDLVGDGIHCIVDPGESLPISRLIIANNLVVAPQGSGIDVVSNEASVACSLISITGNSVVNPLSQCYKLARVTDVTMTGNISTGGTYGVEIQSNCKRVSVAGQVVRECSSTAISVLGTGDETASTTEDITITSPQVYNCASTGSKAYIIVFNTVQRFKVLNPTVIDDRGLAGTGCLAPVRVYLCGGAIVVQGISCVGNTQSGTNGISLSGSNGTVIGNPTSSPGTPEINSTNICVQAV